MTVAAKKRKLAEETTRILREAAAEGSAEAVRQVQEHGLVLTVVEDGFVVEIDPDGTRRILKKVASPRLGLTEGMTFTYR
jgi:hypothetical protein